MESNVAPSFPLSLWSSARSLSNSINESWPALENAMFVMGLVHQIRALAKKDPARRNVDLRTVILAPRSRQLPCAVPSLALRLSIGMTDVSRRKPNVCFSRGGLAFLCLTIITVSQAFPCPFLWVPALFLVPAANVSSGFCSRVIGS